MDRAWIELDKEALISNIESYRRALPDNCKIMGVVKANSYGHGALSVAPVLAEAGVDYFATAALQEAIDVREAGITADILVLGYTDPSNFHKLVEYNITQTVTCPEYAKLLQDYCRENGVQISGHIAVDSGMHRIGYLPSQIKDIEDAYNGSGLVITGIFSHLCVADDENEDNVKFSIAQAECYHKLIGELESKGINLGTTHLLASYAAINYKEFNASYARLGILMFGVRSEFDDYLIADLDPKPVLSLKAHITSVRTIEPGETVSYGRKFTAERTTRVASVAIGYADGLPRCLSNRIRAIVNGKYAAGIGRICMDQLMLDVTDIEDVKVGDTAVFIGCEGDCTIQVEELAENASTITNEILSRLGSRIEGRIFI